MPENETFLKESFEKVANRAIKELEDSVYKSENDFIDMFKTTMTIFLNNGLEERGKIIKQKQDITDEELGKALGEIKKILFKLLDDKIKNIKKDKIYFKEIKK